jgi:hypothetical protein
LNKRWVASTDIQWVLNGQLQQIEIYSDEMQAIEFQRYNKKSKRYERWDIQASGDSSYWIGSWNEESNRVKPDAP